MYLASQHGAFPWKRRSGEVIMSGQSSQVDRASRLRQALIGVVLIIVGFVSLWMAVAYTTQNAIVVFATVIGAMVFLGIIAGIVRARNQPKP